MEDLVIWKYPLRLGFTQTLSLPEDAQLLSVGEQEGTLYLWALVDPSEPLEHLKFAVYATGEAISEGDPMKHLGTVQLKDGLVFHAFHIPPTR